MENNLFDQNGAGNNSEEVTNKVVTEADTNSAKNDKKSKKVFVIIGIILGVILLGVVAFFVYIKLMFTATNFIDNSVTNLTNFLDRVLAINRYDANLDTLMDGNFTINSNIEEYSLDNLNVDFNIGLSLVKEILDVNFVLSNSTNEYDGNIYVDNNRMYIDFTDLYSMPFYSELTENPFNTLNTSDDSMNLVDYKNFINGFIKIFGASLKEADVASSIDGFTATYTYSLNDSNKNAFVQRFNELLEQNEEMQNFLEKMSVADIYISAGDLNDMTLEVIVGIPSGNIQGFTFMVEDTIIELVETSQDRYYFIVNDDVILNIEVDGDNITLVNADASDDSFEATINFSDYTLDVAIESDDYAFNLVISNGGDNIKNIEINVNTTDISANEVSMTIELSVDAISDTEMQINGNLVFVMAEESINMEFDLNSQSGSNLVEEKNFANAQNADELTAEDEEVIAENWLNIIEGLAPGMAEIVRKEQFLTTANIVASNAYFEMATSNNIGCATLSDLGIDSVIGKIEFDSLAGGYKISINDGNYMILDQYTYIDFSDDMIEEYDASRFTEEYYTCEVS